MKKMLVTYWRFILHILSANLMDRESYIRQMKFNSLTQSICLYLFHRCLSLSWKKSTILIIQCVKRCENGFHAFMLRNGFWNYRRKSGKNIMYMMKYINMNLSTILNSVQKMISENHGIKKKKRHCRKK